MKEYWVQWKVAGATLVKAETPSQATETFWEMYDAGEVDLNNDHEDMLDVWTE